MRILFIMKKLLKLQLENIYFLYTNNNSMKAISGLSLFIYVPMLFSSVEIKFAFGNWNFLIKISKS